MPRALHRNHAFRPRQRADSSTTGGPFRAKTVKLRNFFGEWPSRFGRARPVADRLSGRPPLQRRQGQAVRGSGMGPCRRDGKGVRKVTILRAQHDDQAAIQRRTTSVSRSPSDWMCHDLGPFCEPISRYRRHVCSPTQRSRPAPSPLVAGCGTPDTNRCEDCAAGVVRTAGTGGPIGPRDPPQSPVLRVPCRGHQ